MADVSFITHYLVWGILTIQDSKVMHWQPAVFTALVNDCLAGLCHVVTFIFISKQAKIVSRKTPRGKESRRYEVSESNLRFDESAIQ